MASPSTAPKTRPSTCAGTTRCSSERVATSSSTRPPPATASKPAIPNAPRPPIAQAAIAALEAAAPNAIAGRSRRRPSSEAQAPGDGDRAESVREVEVSDPGLPTMEHVDGEDDEEDVEGADHAVTLPSAGRRAVAASAPSRSGARPRAGGQRAPIGTRHRPRSGECGGCPTPSALAHSASRPPSRKTTATSANPSRTPVPALATTMLTPPAQPSNAFAAVSSSVVRTSAGSNAACAGRIGGTGGRGHGCSDIGCERDPGSHSGRGREQRGRLDRVAGYEHESRPAPVRRGRRERCDENGRDELHDGHDSRGRRTPTRKGVDEHGDPARVLTRIDRAVRQQRGAERAIGHDRANARRRARAAGGSSLAPPRAESLTPGRTRARDASGSLPGAKAPRQARWSLASVPGRGPDGDGQRAPARLPPQRPGREAVERAHRDREDRAAGDGIEHADSLFLRDRKPLPSWRPGELLPEHDHRREPLTITTSCFADAIRGDVSPTAGDDERGPYDDNRRYGITIRQRTSNHWGVLASQHRRERQRRPGRRIAGRWRPRFGGPGAPCAPRRRRRRLGTGAAGRREARMPRGSRDTA